LVVLSAQRLINFLRSLVSSAVNFALTGGETDSVWPFSFVGKGKRTNKQEKKKKKITRAEERTRQNKRRREGFRPVHSMGNRSKRVIVTPPFWLSRRSPFCWHCCCWSVSWKGLLLLWKGSE
jgi:hypothetical protein